MNNNSSLNDDSIAYYDNLVVDIFKQWYRQYVK